MDSSHHGVQTTRRIKLLDHQRPLHSMLGAGKVADILLWENPRLSAALLIGATTIWYLLEVAEYSFVTLLCYSLIFAMVAVFVLYNGAELINWNPPNIYDLELSKSTMDSILEEINWILVKFYDASSGKDLKLLVAAAASLWILSTIGTYVSSLNLLYLGFLCMETLPALYDRYQKEVDYLANKGNQDMKRLFARFDSSVLTKIPRGPVKERKSY